MFGASFFGGGLGFGLSAFFVLIQEILIGLPTKVSLSTNQLIASVMGLMGVEIFLEAGLIRSSLVAPAVFGALLGAFLGSKLLINVNNRAVRIFLQGMIVLLGIEMIIRGVRSGS